MIRLCVQWLEQIRYVRQLGWIKVPETGKYSTESGMVVEVSANPSSCLYRSNEGCLDCHKLSSFSPRASFESIMFDALGNDDFVFSRS